MCLHHLQTLTPNQSTPPSMNNRSQLPPQIHGSMPITTVQAPQSIQLQNQSLPGEGLPASTFVAPSVSQNGFDKSPKNQDFPSLSSNGPPQSSAGQPSQALYAQPPGPVGTSQNENSSSSLPALRPVFGVSLDDLLKRDGSAIPLVVYQCVQAVDLFGLEVEGIYRLSGSSTHITKLKEVFDNGEGPISVKITQLSRIRFWPR